MTTTRHTLLTITVVRYVAHHVFSLGVVAVAVELLPASVSLEAGTLILVGCVVAKLDCDVGCDVVGGEVTAAVGPGVVVCWVVRTTVGESVGRGVVAIEGGAAVGSAATAVHRKGLLLHCERNARVQQSVVGALPMLLHN
jgi:hypothetical protein